MIKLGCIQVNLVTSLGTENKINGKTVIDNFCQFYQMFMVHCYNYYLELHHLSASNNDNIS